MAESKIEDMSYQELLQLRLELNQKLEPVNEAINAHHANVLKQLKTGAKVQGFKLKKGRKTRKIVDETKLVHRLLAQNVSKKDIYDVKLKGVPAIDKLIKATFDDEEAALVYKRFVSETVGEPSLEYTGE